MFHYRRQWQVTAAANPEALAEQLTEHSWCSCQGFRLGGYLFLCDQTSPDGAGEWGVVLAGDPARQVESITFSWCDRAKALALIRRVLAGEFDARAWRSGVKADQVETPEAHGRCRACA